MSQRLQDLKLAQDTSSDGDYQTAIRIAERYLRDNPNDPGFLTIMVYCLLGTGQPTVAYTLAKRVTELIPEDGASWMNYGMAANDLWLDDEAIRYYKRALKKSKTDSQRSMVCVNLSSVLVDTGQYREGAKYAEQALELNPDSVKGRANLGFSQLATRNWEEGWKNYRYCLGCEWRPRTDYGAPDWDGESEGTIVIYAEQGLGDVISFGSMVPDMIEWCENHNSRLILEVDPRLEGLFKRTFPNTTIDGTRGVKAPMWKKEDTEIDYALPMGQLGEYFRTSDEDFPDGVFLKADPDRVLQWKALFDTKKKPVIGLAWRGGIPKTGSKFRQWDLEQLLPILESVDAHWVSLQYKPAGKEIEAFKEKHPHIDIVEYPHGTLTSDYDDTVAMIAAMDRVVCMQTAVVHVAGGLGVPVWAFVPRNSQWRYGDEGERFMWAESVRILRQETRGYWDDVVKKAGDELGAYYAGISSPAKGDAQKNKKLRKGRRNLRANGRADNRHDGDRPSA